MTSFRIRPRFRQEKDLSVDKIEDTIKQAIEKKEPEFTTSVIPGNITIRIHPDNRHFWSPQLSLTLEKKENTTLIRGLYGPNPTVWALFFFGYSSLAVIILFSGMVAMSQWMLKIDSFFGWVTLAACVLLAIVYIIAQTGQKIGASQMYDLHHFYEVTIGGKISIS